MAGLIVIGLAVAWLLIAVMIGRWVANWCPARQVAGIVGVFAFVCAIVLPFADEVIGRRQFQRLCSREAVVWVSPNAEKVNAARPAYYGLERLTGFAIPIDKQVSEYVDAVTFDPFLRVTAFHTPGGFIMRAGLNMGSSTSCWPERWTEPYRNLKLDELLKRGKT